MTVDQRFYDYKGPQPLRTLLHACGIDLELDQDPEISGIAPSGRARAGDVCFVEGNAQQAAAVSEDATACFVTASSAASLPDGVIPLVVAQPRFAPKLFGEALFELRAWVAGGEAPSVMGFHGHVGPATGWKAARMARVLDDRDPFDQRRRLTV